MVDSNPTASSKDGLQEIIDRPSGSHSGKSLACLIESLGSSDLISRSKASNALALFILHQPQPGPLLSPLIVTSLDSNRLSDVCAGLRALSAILKFSPGLGLELISRDRVLSRLEDATALASLPKRSPSSTALDHDLAFVIANFLALATNHKSVRESLPNEWPQALKDLTSTSLSNSTTVSLPARHAASLALIKLRIAAEERVSEKSSSGDELPALGRLIRILLDGLLSHPDISPSTIIEGLALACHLSSPRNSVPR